MLYNCTRTPRQLNKHSWKLRRFGPESVLTKKGPALSLLTHG
jgi:hypothetical protein